MAVTITAADGMGVATVDVISNPNGVGYLVTITSLGPASSPFGAQVNGMEVWEGVARPDEGA